MVRYAYCISPFPFSAHLWLHKLLRNQVKFRTVGDFDIALEYLHASECPMIDTSINQTHGGNRALHPPSAKRPSTSDTLLSRPNSSSHLLPTQSSVESLFATAQVGGDAEILKICTLTVGLALLLGAAYPVI
jgi:hypothetical protein